MPRPLFLCTIPALTLVLLAAPAAAAATTSLDADAIKAGLHTTTLEEDGFVDRAVAMVEDGRLSAGLVQSTFIWAQGEARYKFQHFRSGLLEQVPSAAIRAELDTGQQVATPPRRGFFQRVLDRLRLLMPPQRRPDRIGFGIF